MNASLRYDFQAEAFRIMTGHMAPGKDASPMSYPAPFEERQAAWDTWLAEHGACVRAMTVAAERVLLQEDRE